MRLWRNQQGDTIVEVLIAMAVASAVLGGAYAVTNRTMQNSQQAQEHSQAQELASQQIERIVAIAASDSDVQKNAIFSATPPYNCADLTDGTLVPQPQLASATDLSNAGKFNNRCVSSGPVEFRAAFTYFNNQYFRVTIIWPSVTGNGEDKVEMVYKAFKS